MSAWPERRPPRTEGERAQIADQCAAHLPRTQGAVQVSDADLDAMRAAFIRRFDEQLPRTETLMAVAHIGYRIALRDIASGTEAGTGETERLGPKGDLQPLVKDRYAILPADALRMLVMRLNAASVDTLPKGRDAKQGSAGTEGSAVPKADAQKDHPND